LINLQIELVGAERTRTTIDELTGKPKAWVATGINAVVLGRHSEDAIVAM
jgi:hypothetical protein